MPAASNAPRLERTVRRLELMAEDRRRHSAILSDRLYYQLTASYFRRAADPQGRKVVAHSVMVPTEILYALNLVPLHLEAYATLSAPVLNDVAESLSLAKGLGLPAELCSVHRTLAGLTVQGSIPCDAVVTGHVICDSSYRSGHLLRVRRQVPGFCLDRSYRYGQGDALYYFSEIQELIPFLEGVAGRRLDPERLAQAMEYSLRMVELHREIYRLRQAVPCPAPNRLGTELMFMAWLFSGAPEGVAFYETVRDELQERVAAGKGCAPRERFRLLSTFPTPAHYWKLLDWMEKVHGAIIAADPYCARWGEFDWDPTQPLLTLAHKWMASPLCRQMHAPASLSWVPETVEDARQYRVDGAFFWAAAGCPQSCASIRLVKDALMEQLGIPALVLDVDILDPSFVPEEAVKEKFEAFFERLAEQQADRL